MRTSRQEEVCQEREETKTREEIKENKGKEKEERREIMGRTEGDSVVRGAKEKEK